jgi:septum formation protein
MRLILASQSPRRKRFMEMLGLEFEVIPSQVDERAVKESDPVKLARTLARMKAEDVAKRIRADGKVGEAVVIGADTLVSFQGRIIGKARDRDQAIEILRSYRGREHEQITGFCLINTRTGRVVVDHDVTKARVREMSEKEIEGYVRTREPREGAGCYTPRAHTMLFRGFEGSWTNGVGLPMGKLIPLLGEVMRDRKL